MVSLLPVSFSTLEKLQKVPDLLSIRLLYIGTPSPTSPFSHFHFLLLLIFLPDICLRINIPRAKYFVRKSVF